MGSSGSGRFDPPWYSASGFIPTGSKSSDTTTAEEVVTPAVAQTISEDTEKAQETQAEARSRLRGIRSTYNRFAESSGGTTGSQTKLG